jgi:hypothetical protein
LISLIIARIGTVDSLPYEEAMMNDSESCFKYLVNSSESVLQVKKMRFYVDYRR